jgi:uncharacterized protein YbjT (DUF2867 family)
MSQPAASRTVLLAGATGLVGGELLAGLVADASVGTVHVLVRRPLAAPMPGKVHVHVVDFTALPVLPAAPKIDEAYLAIGTTIKVAGGEMAFRAVDLEANLAVARAALAAGARRIGLVSAMGADVRSRIFYNRVKGELEDALSALWLEGLVIARPSLLMGDRESLGQPERPGEKIGTAVGRLLRPLIPADYRPVAAHDVAAALLANVPTARGKRVMLSGALQAKR